MSNTLSLPRGKVDTNLRIEAGEYLPSGPKTGGLTRRMHKRTLDALDTVSKYTPRLGDNIGDVAEALGISRNIFAASLMIKSTDNIPPAWIRKEIQYQYGWVMLPSGTKYPVAMSH